MYLFEGKHLSRLLEFFIFYFKDVKLICCTLTFHCAELTDKICTYTVYEVLYQLHADGLSVWTERFKAETKGLLVTEKPSTL